MQEDQHHWHLTDGPGIFQFRRIRVDRQNFSVGRSSQHALVLDTPAVSKDHATLRVHGRDLWVSDLGSTNGTFVNGERINSIVQLNEDDVLRFGDAGFRVQWRPASLTLESITQAVESDWQAPIEYRRLIERLISQRALTTHFQPILRLSDKAVIGYESLVRGTSEGLPTDPGKLFELADKIGLAGELSDISRLVALQTAGLDQLLSRLPKGRAAGLYSNLHPEEVKAQDLGSSLTNAKNQTPGQSLVVEVHEQSLLDPSRTTDLIEQMRGLEIAVAFDDFGSGLDRLRQLAVCPPDILKFDRTLIAELRDVGNRGIRTLLGNLVAAAHDLGCTVAAEGVETAHQASVCIDLGFDLAQGYYFGRPASAAEWLEA